TTESHAEATSFQAPFDMHEIETVRPFGAVKIETVPLSPRADIFIMHPGLPANCAPCASATLERPSAGSARKISSATRAQESGATGVKSGMTAISPAISA